jgi:hypothetical protein
MRGSMSTCAAGPQEFPRVRRVSSYFRRGQCPLPRAFAWDDETESRRLPEEKPLATVWNVARESGRESPRSKDFNDCAWERVGYA